MPGYRIISADSHVCEPSDLFTTRMEPKYRDRAPKVVRQESGGDFWEWGIKTKGPVAFFGTQAGRRFDEPERLSWDDTFDNVRPGGYIPEEHVKDMDADGIDMGIIYTSLGLALFRTEDSPFMTAMFTTFNDWLAEFCGAYPKRLKGVAMVNVDDVQEGVRELERVAKLELIGAMITDFPAEDRRYYLPDYEPLWAAAHDLEMPLSFHAATNRVEAVRDPTPEHDGGFAAFQCNFDYYVRASLTDMIFHGVFERHPKLQIGAVEQQLGWVPHFLNRIDYNYTQRPGGMVGYRFKNSMVPSDFFHRNVFIGFQDDTLGIRLRDLIGVDNLQWGSDYPHPESTFPRSREILEEILEDCTEEEKAKIAGGNATRVYRV